MGRGSRFTSTTRRRVLSTVGAAGALGLAGCLGGGGEFPAEPITVIIGFGAGGSNDTRYRRFKPYFEEGLDGETVVENREGASGRIGFSHMFGTEGDGYTLIAQYLPTSVLGAALFDTQYEMADITPIGTVDAGYNIVASSAGQYADLDEVVADAADGGIHLGSTGIGSTTHFGAVSIVEGLGIDYQNEVTLVPFDSGADAGAAAARGDVDLAYTGADLTGLLADGRIDVLLAARPDPSPRYPEVPTVDDVAYDLPVIAAEMAVHGPPGVPDDHVELLEEALIAAVDREEYRDQLEENGLSPVGVGSTETRQKIEEIQAAAERYEQLVEIEE